MMNHDDNKTYIAYAICRHEYGCGCEYTTHADVYAKNSNLIKQFTSYEEAEEAAVKRILEVNGDDWNVI
jgi:hypothetical protein